MLPNRIAVAVRSRSALLLRIHAADLARPNILLITADDMHWDSVGDYGCPMAETTPKVDRLAVEGFRFGFAYVLVSLCPPSRQVMFRAIKDSSR
jgi:hypothetical protein